MKKLNIPVGISDFAKIRDRKYYYVDKTKLISDLLEEETAEVTLITRPRRFGKTMAMSMLSHFFDIRKDSKAMFQGLKIAENTELCDEWMNQWPVLFLSFRRVDGLNFQGAYGMLQATITDVCENHLYLLDSPQVSAYPKEVMDRLLRGTASEKETKGSLLMLTKMMEAHYGKPVILLIENPDGGESAYGPGVPDEAFVRGKVPMTKEEVRWVSVNRLTVRPTDTVWDVGAGTGAVTLELARKASDGTVYAVERKPEAVALLHENRIKLGGYNVKIIEGAAPEALENLSAPDGAAPAALEALPAPDCVFVGGSGGRMQEILALAREKNPEVHVVVNAIALETLFAAQTALKELGFSDIEVTQLAATRGKPVGAYTMLTANNPVFILSGRAANDTK